MAGAEFPPSLAAIDARSDEGVFAAFTRGVQITSLSLLALAVPVLTILIVWSGRRWRQQRHSD
jgi:hypothetical protein